MTLRKKRRLLGGCIALLALLAVAVMLIGTVWIKIVLVAALVGYVALFSALWRCPYCGGGLGRIDQHFTYCPHCGKELGCDERSDDRS